MFLLLTHNLFSSVKNVILNNFEKCNYAVNKYNI